MLTISSFNDENLVYKFYKGVCNILMQGGFQLRKWIRNFRNFQKHLNENSCEDNSKSYVKKVLGAEWNVSKDEFLFTFSDIIETAEYLGVAKRNILKISTMFFDPLGLTYSLVLQAKLLFREACILNVTCDVLLPTEFVVKYNNFMEELRKPSFISVSRYLFIGQHNVAELELHDFCDASIQAYSTTIYIRSLKNDNIVTNLLTAKSKNVKLELMSCFLLSRLIASARKVLSVQVKMSNVVRWFDSKVALY